MTQDQYNADVDRYTEQSMQQYGHLIDPQHKRGPLYEVDHMYSKYDGFWNDVPAFIVGSVVNLELLPARLNESKGRNSSITREQLYADYANWERSRAPTLVARGNSLLIEGLRQRAVLQRYEQMLKQELGRQKLALALLAGKASE